MCNKRMHKSADVAMGKRRTKSADAKCGCVSKKMDVRITVVTYITSSESCRIFSITRSVINCSANALASVV